MIPFDAPIVDVTVYVNRASVTRRGTAHIPTGEQTLVLANMPRSLDADSIRARGKGAGVRILGVDLVTRYTTETPVADAAALQQRLDALEEQANAMLDEDAVQSERLDMLKALRENAASRFAKSLATGKASLSALQALTQYLNDELNNAHSARRDITSRQRELDKEIKAVQQQLQQARPTLSTEWRDIQVSLDASQETDIELEIIYNVNGASWKALYDVRLSGEQVQLTYLAQVQQQSGENWDNVRLSLSTARPAARMNLPKLNPWYINRFVPPPLPPSAPMMQRLVGPAMASPLRMKKSEFIELADAGEGAAPPIPEAEFVQAEVESTPSAVTYHIAKPASIPSDGSPHKTMVTTLDLRAQIDYLVAPRLALDVYRRARITNQSALLLLPGEAQIFNDAAFAGAMKIERVIAPNESFEAQLGIEDRIKVERDLLERSTGKTLIGNTRRVTIGYKIKATNNLPTPAHLIVMDQIPLAQHEDIKVRLQDMQPKPSEQSDLNILKWEFDLPAQTAREIPFAFVLEHPRDMRVTGLEMLDTADA
jgi:uncharacterized protein (TIGR02231 family)